MTVNKAKLCLYLLITLLVSIYSQMSMASWIGVPPEHLVSSAHLVVTGHVFKISGDIRKKESVYRLAYIKIDQVIKNDLVGKSFKSGDTITITMAPKKPKYSLSFSFKKGDSGIWLINHYGNAFGLGRPDCLMSIDKLMDVRKILTELNTSYTEALENEIPNIERNRKKILSLPPISQDKIDDVMRKPLSADSDSGNLRVVNTQRKPLEALFLNQSGQVIGGIPYHAQDTTFKNGLLSVITTWDKGTTRRYGFVDRNGHLVSKTLYSYAEQYSEGRAVVAREKLFGFIDTDGKQVIPCVYNQVSSFSGGMARVVKGQTVFLIDMMGKVIFQGKDNQILCIGEGWACININGATIGYIDSKGKLALNTAGTNYVAENAFKESLSKVWIRETQPVQHGFIDRKGKLAFSPKAWTFNDFSDGLVAFATDTTELKWGYMDKTGNIVISPRYIRAGNYSDGMASVTYSCWIKRPTPISKDKEIELSPNAHKYIRGMKKGFINKNAEMINSIGFDNVGEFAAGFARVKLYVKGGTFDGIMDKAGKIVLVISNPMANSEIIDLNSLK